MMNFFYGEFACWDYDEISQTNTFYVRKWTCPWLAPTQIGDYPQWYKLVEGKEIEILPDTENISLILKLEEFYWNNTVIEIRYRTQHERFPEGMEEAMKRVPKVSS